MLILPVVLLCIPQARGATLTSPSGSVTADVRVEQGRLTYSVLLDGKPVVSDSRMGIILGGGDLGENAGMGKPEPYDIDASYPARGVKTRARGRCRGLRIPITHAASGTEWTLDCRAYDDGFAFRYVVPGSGPRTIQRETTSFTVPSGSRCWYFERPNDWKLKTYAGLWQSAPIERMPGISPTGPVQGPPLVFELPDHAGYAVLTEAALFDYSGMRLQAVADRTFRVDLSDTEGFVLDGEIRTPWRVIMLTPDLDSLVNSDLISSLCPPPDERLFSDTNFIRPGRSVWRWWSAGTGTPEQERRFVDDAARLGFEYSTIDEGWKDWENPWDELAAICRHAASKDVGIFVWCHWNDINDPRDDYASLDAYLARVAQAGARGVKIDFMNGEDLARVRFNEAVLRHAARRRLMVNFHGCGKPTGESRTYPNEITREGVRGLELNRMDKPLPASHNAALPFTRFLVGHADYTPLTMDPNRLGDTTVAHQLATLVAFTSPLQVLAEDPAKLLDDPRMQPVVAMLRGIPTVWDETRVLPGSAIGNVAVLARRSGATWYVAGINGPDAREFDLALDFLDDPQYAADLIRDAGKPADFRHESRKLLRGATLSLAMPAGGGFLMRLQPADPGAIDWDVEQRGDGFEIDAGSYRLTVNAEGFRFGFDRAAGHPDIAAHPRRGLELDGEPVTETTRVERDGDHLIVDVKNAAGRTARVCIRPGRHHVEFELELPEEADIAVQLAGLGPAYGLGDHGGQHSAANLVGFEAHDMHNDGGPQKCRFFAPFVIFPAHRFAGVALWPGFVDVSIQPDAYRMAAKGARTARFVYFLGEAPEIYLAYKRVRDAAGFPGVPPKYRFFQLGWESWDALRWDTNAGTVRDILERFIARGYPIRWAVTGSGFWADGGATTSFGQWHPHKYPDPIAFRQWLHKHDIHWLIGLRTNFTVADGPFTATGLEHNFFMKNESGELLTRKSTAFPKTDCYVLDGAKPEAAAWFADLFARWGVDGAKEDTMLPLPRADVFNGPMRALAERGALVMARNAAFTSPGTLLRMEDMVRIDTITARMPVTWLQYAACAAPNVYCDAVGFGGMQDNPKGAIRHAWMSALTAGMSVGAEPWHWTPREQACLEKAIRFHLELAPYLHSAAVESHLSGYPHTLTPLPIAYPDDAATYDLARHETQQYSWLVGPSLLATPLLRADYRTNDRMDVYLPEGEWLDYETGERYTGPRTLKDHPMPQDKAPCFVGGAGILVLSTPAPPGLQAVVYPLTPNPAEYRFVHPDGIATTRITKANTGWHTENLRILDLATGGETRFSRDPRSGAVRFPILPNHNYRIVGGAPPADSAKPAR